MKHELPTKTFCVIKALPAPLPEDALAVCLGQDLPSEGKWL